MERLGNVPYVDKRDPWSSHAIIVEWLRQLPESSVILDVGTASGTIGRLCRDGGFYRKGIEPNLAWAEIARPDYEELSLGSVEDTEDKFIEGADAIILADVLEHLVDPQGTLHRVASLQQPECLILVSVPNIANLWVRMNLLFGHFDYSDRGILDRTHLRFFTYSSLVTMLEKCRLDIRKFRATPIPLNLIHPFFETNPVGRYLHRTLASLTQLVPTILGYQFVVLATKRVSRKAQNG